MLYQSLGGTGQIQVAYFFFFGRKDGSNKNSDGGQQQGQQSEQIDTKSGGSGHDAGTDNDSSYEIVSPSDYPSPRRTTAGRVDDEIAEGMAALSKLREAAVPAASSVDLESYGPVEVNGDGAEPEPKINVYGEDDEVGGLAAHERRATETALAASRAKFDEDDGIYEELDVLPPPQADAGLSGSGPDSPELWVAKFNFLAEDDDKLSFKQGDRIEVLDKPNEDWFEIRIVGQADVGLGPSTHLTPPTTAPVARRPLPTVPSHASGTPDRTEITGGAGPTEPTDTRRRSGKVDRASMSAARRSVLSLKRQNSGETEEDESPYAEIAPLEAQPEAGSESEHQNVADVSIGRAADLNVSNEELMAIMNAVKAGSMSIDDAIATAISAAQDASVPEGGASVPADDTEPSGAPISNEYNQAKAEELYGPGATEPTAPEVSVQSQLTSFPDLFATLHAAFATASIELLAGFSVWVWS